MLRDLQDTMLALDERLGTLEAAHGHSTAQTRQLAVGVAQLGDALTRRIQALEEANSAPPVAEPEPEPALFLAPQAKPVRRPPERRVAITVALAFVLALTLGSLWFWRTELMDHARPTPPAPLAATPTPAPITAPAPAPVAKSAAGTAADHSPVHSTGPKHAAAVSSLDQLHTTGGSQSADKPPASFVLYSQNAATASH